MKKSDIIEVINQVFNEPQVSLPLASYQIKDFCSDGYKSEYIDIEDLRSYQKRLKEHLILRINLKSND